MNEHAADLSVILMCDKIRNEFHQLYSVYFFLCLKYWTIHFAWKYIWKWKKLKWVLLVDINKILFSFSPFIPKIMSGRQTGFWLWNRKYKCRKSNGYLDVTFGNFMYRRKRKGGKKMPSIIFMEFLVHFWIKGTLWTTRSLVSEATPDFRTLCCHLSIYEIPVTYSKRLWDQLTEEHALWIMFPDTSFC